MIINEFIELFAEAIEVDAPRTLTPNTKFHELDEWSSISVMLLIAFFDDEFDKEITPSEINAAKTIEDLFKIAIA